MQEQKERQNRKRGWWGSEKRGRADAGDVCFGKHAIPIPAAGKPKKKKGKGGLEEESREMPSVRLQEGGRVALNKAIRKRDQPVEIVKASLSFCPARRRGDWPLLENG